MGCDIASYARGSTMDGPGPYIKRFGGAMRFVSVASMSSNYQDRNSAAAKSAFLVAFRNSFGPFYGRYVGTPLQFSYECLQLRLLPLAHLNHGLDERLVAVAGIL